MKFITSSLNILSLLDLILLVLIKEKRNSFSQLLYRWCKITAITNYAGNGKQNWSLPELIFLLSCKSLCGWEINMYVGLTRNLKSFPLVLKYPSHPLCFARLEDDMRHFRCHRNSSFLQCEVKSLYILPNIAHSGLNSPSTRSQTISGFI